MPCYHPWTGYYSKDLNPSGKRSLVTNPRQALQPDEPIPMKCGRCIGCRLLYSATWAMRFSHEASLHADNCFLTLTFRDECLPEFNSIAVSDCQLFMKRYRAHVDYCFPGRKIRMAYCGEYGDQTGRPHYHFLIFGHDFSEDRKRWGQRGDYPVFRSASLERLWPFGNSEIGTLTFDSAAYVARYVTKKLHGEAAADKYWVIDYSTGELLHERTREFMKMSRKPGIGRSWFEKHKVSMYERDQVVVLGPSGSKVFKPPKYYDSQFEIVDPYRMDDVRESRLISLRNGRVALNNTYARLRVREQVKLAQISTLTRSL